MAIRAQVDPTYNDPLVAFVESEDVFCKRVTFDEYVSGEVYFVSIHRKPITTIEPMGIAWCKHRHRSIDAARRCAKRLLLEWRARV